MYDMYATYVMYDIYATYVTCGIYVTHAIHHGMCDIYVIYGVYVMYDIYATYVICDMYVIYVKGGRVGNPSILRGGVAATVDATSATPPH